MSKLNDNTSTGIKFNDSMAAGVKSLVEHADTHDATHTIVFKADKVEMPEGITPESLHAHVGFINTTSAQVPAAVGQIGMDRYEDTKHEKWDGVLDFGQGLIFTGGVQLREEVDGEISYGVTQSMVDHAYTQELTDWMMSNQEDLAAKAAKLFD